LAAVAIPALIDPNDYKDELGAAAKEHTGRDLTVDGDVSMTVFPWLGVKIGRATLGNGAGFSSSPFASAERVDVPADTASVSNLTLSMADMNVTGQLSIPSMAKAPRVTGKLDIAPFDLKALLGALGIEAPNTADPNVLGAVAVKTGLTASAKAVTLTPLILTLDDTNLTGSVGVADLAAGALRFDLKGDAIDLDRYLPPSVEGEAPKAAPPGAAATALPLDTLRGLNIVGKLVVDQIGIGKLKLSRVSASVDARDGLVKLSPVSATLYDGTYTGDIAVDAKGKVAKLSVNETLSGVQLAPLLTDLQGKAPIAGAASATVKATASGNSPDELKRGLNGNGSFKFTDGAINGINMAAMIRDAKAKLTGSGAAAGDAAPKTDFSVMGGTFKITKGVVNNPDFAAKSPLLRITGKGTASLVSEALDYRTTISVVATAKGQGGKDLGDLAGLDVPMIIGGTFAQPTYGIDPEMLLKLLASSKLKDVVGAQKAKVEQAVKEKLSGAVGGAVGGEVTKVLGGVLGGSTKEESGTASDGGTRKKVDPAAAATSALKSLLK
jgi:AsmA protein